MKIGELAAATGVAPSAIRFYEKSGLLPAAQRGSNGYRSYSNDAIERLRLIQVAQSLGFSLDALGGVFASAEGFRKDELMRKPRRSTRRDRRAHVDAEVAAPRAS
ncbi:DNA-binding transcriptional regulator, MerR family [Variovorax sp. YR752]|uniref:MerR family transcriptional regulator n=1 Tax=Variovorax sp. YR752 TaxID=1884383 RepID=UPI000BC3CA13|nr:MerR family transcriptional regulator [Variovorax sp. YR752]SOD30217.1 DNA-binding transcriptional regulator, MerR family [Variovorax sp. YR752]